MEIVLVKGDPVINRVTRQKGIVIDVNNQWGWFVVKYENGFTRRYFGFSDEKDCSVMIDLNRNNSQL